jgi:hypothetical protein
MDRRVIPTLWLAGFITIAITCLYPAPAHPKQPFMDEAPPIDQTLKWIPIGRVKPDTTTEIQLTNRTRETLEYLITTHTDFRILKPGETTTLLVNDLPLFLNVNAQRTTGLTYSITTTGNRIKIGVALSTSSQNDTTLNVDSTGAIYLY